MTHLFLDFFGTLVDYTPSRTSQDYRDTHQLLTSMGCTLTYAEFQDGWTASSAVLDRRSAADDSEYSMDEVTTHFLRSVLPGTFDGHKMDAIRDSYLAAWNTGVRYPPGVGDLVAQLAAERTLFVVSNTHQPDLVLRHLEAMDVGKFVSGVVTSVDVGWRKPHPAMYAAALALAGVDAANVTFVGDTLDADYLGPRRAGMQAFLIGEDAVVPEADRLSSLFDLPAALAGKTT